MCCKSFFLIKFWRIDLILSHSRPRRLLPSAAQWRMPISRHSSPACFKQRLTSIDALRGLAMVWMTIFHFCFDLNFFDWWRQDFLSSPIWTLQRTAIVCLFVFCAGLGQAVAHEQALGWRRFWGRWGQVVSCAFLVSLASWFMFPKSFIYFGVLHGMLVMLLLARVSAGWGKWLWPLGLLAITAPWFGQAALSSVLVQWARAFDSRALNWLGLITHKPFTEDYVPVLPWLGVMWWGMAIGQWLLDHRRHWLAVPSLAQRLSPLVLLGRHSLLYYMLHQPVMIGAMGAVGWLIGRPA